MDAIYQLSSLQKVYNDRTVLDVDHLTVRPAEILGVVGPSGAGKSTLLRLLAFLEPATAGQIIYLGRTTGDDWPDLTARRRLAMVFQRPYLLRRSVYDNVAYGLRLRGSRDSSERINRLLDQLGLTELANAAALKLSAGEMQRVALARALILRPDILLLDEPTANLDPYNIKLIEQIVLSANRGLGTTVIIVTHNIFQARRLADRVALLLQGRLIETAPTETFFQTPQHPQTAAFINGEIIY